MINSKIKFFLIVEKYSSHEGFYKYRRNKYASLFVFCLRHDSTIPPYGNNKCRKPYETVENRKKL